MFAFLSLYLFRYSPLSLSSPFPTFAVLDVGFEWFCGLRGGGLVSGFSVLSLSSVSLSLSCCYSWFRFMFFFLLFLLFRVLSVGNILLLVVVFFVLLLSLFSLHSPSALLSPLSSLLFSFLCCCFFVVFWPILQDGINRQLFFFLNVWIFFFLFLSHFSSFLRCLHIYLHVLFHRHDLLFLSFPISPPLLHFITSSSTPSHHHHDLLFLLSSLLTLIPSTFLLFTLHRLFNSPPFSFSIFSHPHCHRHCCWNHLPNHVCLFYLVFFPRCKFHKTGL